MKKILMSIATIFLIFIFVAACQKEPRKDIPKAPTTEATGDAAADSFGNDFNRIDEDLDNSELSDVDNGLSDAENI
ncbi:hypothetical protein HYS31_01650 [Candidatus Woesearchaeota archaeon]|nr:hypothetical protein [Candidatus Woesearchaeota archaeon]